jgi:hypothetical protein
VLLLNGDRDRDHGHVPRRDAAAVFGRPVFVPFVVFHARRWNGDSRTDRNRVGVDIPVAIDPGQFPRPVVHDYRMRSPAEADPAPAPGQERADENAGADADGATDIETGTRAEIHNVRIVIRDVDDRRIGRDDFNIAGTRRDYLYCGVVLR